MAAQPIRLRSPKRPERPTPPTQNIAIGSIRRPTSSPSAAASRYPETPYASPTLPRIYVGRIALFAEEDLHRFADERLNRAVLHQGPRGLKRQERASERSRSARNPGARTGDGASDQEKMRRDGVLVSASER
jgi:hypothetical protein